MNCENRTMTRLAGMTLATALALSGIAGEARADEGEKIFRFYCAQCHGLAGKGDGPNLTEDFPVIPRDFTSADEMSTLSDANLKNVILDGGPAVGRSPMMPPWGKTLDEAEVDALIDYLRVLCGCEG